MVVSAHGLASEAGANVLRKGGNAFDAAVATSLMLGVVEPAFSGIGGGGFALLHTSSGENVALDYRERAPLKSTASMFSEGSDANRVGPLAVATPGLLAGHKEILETYGTMKFRELARAAVETARAGFSEKSVSRDLIIEKNPDVLGKMNRFKTTAEIFVGSTNFPLLSSTLDGLGLAGPGDFYHGSIPSAISRQLNDIGGIISEEDFARYDVRRREPVTGEYGGYQVVSMPPPSAGGALLIHGFGVLDETDGRFGRREEDRMEFMAALIGSMLKEKAAFGDPDFTEVPVSKLTSKEAIRKAADDMQSEGSEPPRHPSHDIGSTTHFCVVDRHGNAVAATETVECYYGSGVSVPRYGILLNDEMHDFETTPGRPNSIAPLKRPASSMSPTILLKDGNPFLVLGAAGSERIISSILQVVTNIVERRMSLQRALAAPRLHPSKEGLLLENGFEKSDIRRLQSLGLSPRVAEKSKLFFGGVQALMVDEDGTVTGAADPRRRGLAVRE
jgi:gamma-glutamyltranspeptidase/glutathione hydrolase